MFLRYSLLISVAFCFFSCSNKKSRYSKNKVFRYNEYANVTSLDPAFAKNQANIWVVNQLFSGLVQLDDSLQVQPDIAKKWHISNNGKTYTFILRNDVKFHKHILFGSDSTRKVIANDFEYSFKRLLNPKLAAPGGWVLKNVSNFKAINDTIFKINLKQSFPPFLSLLSMKYCSVVPKEITEHYGTNFRSNPIGTGPFKFKLWVENTKLVLRKNKLYYEKENGKKLPYLEAVAVTFLPDKQSEFMQFIQGNLDFLNSIDPSYKDDILTSEGKLQPRYANKITMQKSPFLNTEYLGIFMGEKDRKIHLLIRQAINYGFDRVKMIRFLRNEIGIPAENGFIPKGLSSFSNRKIYTYKPEKAKRLIQQYRTETKDIHPKIIITTNSQYIDLCEYIQHELQNIGLQVTIDVIPSATLKQSKANGKLSVFRASWIADYPDAENYLSLFYSKNFAPNGPNYTHFKNSLFDKMYEESMRVTSFKKRLRLNKKMDSMLMLNAPIVPLYYDEVVRFTQKNVKGLSTNAVNMLNLKRVNKS